MAQFLTSYDKVINISNVFLHLLKDEFPSEFSPYQTKMSPLGLCIFFSLESKTKRIKNVDKIKKLDSPKYFNFLSRSCSQLLVLPGLKHLLPSVAQ